MHQPSLSPVGRHASCHTWPDVGQRSLWTEIAVARAVSGVPDPGLLGTQEETWFFEAQTKYLLFQEDLSDLDLVIFLESSLMVALMTF